MDHKIIHDFPIEYHEKQNGTFITTSATTNTNNAYLGLLINRTPSAALAEVKPYNSRILVTHSNGNPATTIIIHYPPAEGTTKAVDHHERLSVITRTVPKQNVLLVIGDCNAHLSPEEALYNFHDRRNNIGKLIGYSLETNLIIANNRFPKKREKTFTFMSEINNCKSQIDYILINRN